MQKSRMELVKDIVWNLFVFVLYYVYCFAMLLLFHLLLFTVIKLGWEIDTIAWMALAASVLMMAVRLVRRARGRQRKIKR